jgi:hypothetical protein
MSQSVVLKWCVCKRQWRATSGGLRAPRRRSRCTRSPAVALWMPSLWNSPVSSCYCTMWVPVHALGSCCINMASVSSVSMSYGCNLDITATVLDIIHRPVAGEETSSFYWARLSKFHLKTETECSLRNDRTMDNVQNCDSYINIPS